jgi:hypothetical protein
MTARALSHRLPPRRSHGCVVFCVASSKDPARAAATVDRRGKPVAMRYLSL